MKTQLELGEMWDAGDLVVCSCAARGPVMLCDRKIGAGLTERRCVCKGCEAETVVRLSAPEPKTAQRPAPLLSTMKG